MKRRTRPPTHPGAILKRHYLDAMGVTVSEVASSLHVSRKTLSKIVNERGAVTPDMALRLARAFATSPELWLNLQQNYDLWHAAHGSQAWRRARTLAMSGSAPKYDAQPATFRVRTVPCAEP